MNMCVFKPPHINLFSLIMLPFKEKSLFMEPNSSFLKSSTPKRTRKKYFCFPGPVYNRCWSNATILEDKRDKKEEAISKRLDRECCVSVNVLICYSVIPDVLIWASQVPRSENWKIMTSQNLSSARHAEEMRATY